MNFVGGEGGTTNASGISKKSNLFRIFLCIILSQPTRSIRSISFESLVQLIYLYTKGLPFLYGRYGRTMSTNSTGRKRCWWHQQVSSINRAPDWLPISSQQDCYGHFFSFLLKQIPLPSRKVPGKIGTLIHHRKKNKKSFWNKIWIDFYCELPLMELVNLTFTMWKISEMGGNEGRNDFLLIRNLWRRKTSVASVYSEFVLIEVTLLNVKIIDLLVADFGHFLYYRT